MSWPRMLVLVRHAESEGNLRSVDERAEFDVSTHEYKLTERGRKQAEITGQYIKECFGDFDIRYVSYYQRSKETMEIMCPGARVYEDPRLAEGQRGIWHILTKQQMLKKFPEEFKRRDREGLYHYRPLGGENWPDIELRIHSFLDTLSRDYGDQKVLMVVHGHWLILLQRLIHHFSIAEAMGRYRSRIFENASVTIYENSFSAKNGKPRLVLRRENLIPWQGKV